MINKSFKHTLMGDGNVSSWWPEQLNLKILQQNPSTLKPTDDDFDYQKAFSRLDLQAIKEDLTKIMTKSQPWWPADYGHYGPLFIRMAWHSAGTYRITDGRGGAGGGSQRFAPLNSWPDNANLDKARRLLWPIKQKYGQQISWADLMILAGNVAMESMGFKTLGFAGGREDVWESEEDIYWGAESEWLEDKRHNSEGKLENPLAAVQMGLIYVNPEGPNSEPNVLAAAEDIRQSFKRMGMGDRDTVALIAGGHTFGKNHGAADPSRYIGSEPEAAPIEEQGLGWKNSFGTGKGANTITSGLEGAWTPTPTKWDNSFLDLLFKYEWNLVKSPAGAWQWEPINPNESDLAPDAHIADKKQKTVMLTTDLALRMDPQFEKISREFLENPDIFAKAFAHAWFKLTHRDLGPKSRYLGSEVPNEDFLWQDPLPQVPKKVINNTEIDALKEKILTSGIAHSDLIYVAWSAASTYRHSDKRGGANGARIALKPQCDWKVNQPERLQSILTVLKKIQHDFTADISLSDLIVLGGVVAIEQAIKQAGYAIKVPFRPGRVDATQTQTDPYAFSHLEPIGDGFRNYLQEGCEMPAEQLLLDKAQLLNLSVPEMCVLVAGMRVLGINYDNSKLGQFTDNVGILNHNFFVNLLDMDIAWRPSATNAHLYEGVIRDSEDIRWIASRVDLIFGSNSQLRAQAEFYAQEDNKEKFIRDFVSAWDKVMSLDRFDL